VLDGGAAGKGDETMDETLNETYVERIVRQRKTAEARLLAAYEEVTRQATRAEQAEAEIEQLRNEKESLREQLDEALAQIESMWKTIAP
jgi:chromosome segregation ATPase